MKKSKILWFLVFPLIITVSIFLIGWKSETPPHVWWYINRLFWPALTTTIGRTHYPGLEPIDFLGFAILIVTLLVLLITIYSYINKKRKTGNSLLIIVVLLVILNYTWTFISSGNQQRVNNIEYSAKSVVDKLVKENLILPDESCTNVKILKKTGGNIYKAIATMESGTKYLIEIEDLNDYIQVKIIPATGLDN